MLQSADLNDYEDRIYLSKRNLLVLLSKLDRFEKGEETKCAIIKRKNIRDPYCNTIDEVAVIAIPDDHFYINRLAGEMHPVDEQRIKDVKF